MKKQYSKPGIIIEDFRVAEHIASCDGVQHNNTWGSPQQWSKNTCAWLDTYGNALFIEEMQVCTAPVKENANVGGICYNNPSGLYTIFGS